MPTLRARIGAPTGLGDFEGKPSPSQIFIDPGIPAQASPMHLKSVESSWEIRPVPRADLIVNLVKAGSQGDQQLFRTTVEAIAAEERAKHHHQLADKLEANLRSATARPRPRKSSARTMVAMAACSTKSCRGVPWNRCC